MAEGGPPPWDPPHTCADRPRHPLDYVTVSLIGAAVVPFIAANIVLFLNRSYLPIKTKSVDITVLSSVGGLIWIGSTIITFNHLGRHRGFLTICSLWTFWLQVCFGFGVWLNSFSVRLINLYRIFILRKRGFSLPIIPLFALLSPLIAFCIVATAARASRYKLRTDTHVMDCVIQRVYGVIILLIFALYFAIFLALAVRLRNIMAQFNEFRIIRQGGAAALLLYLLTIAILQTSVYLQVTGRCFCTLAVALAVFYSFWARNGIPVYKVIFEKAQYAREFREQLRLHQENGSEVHRRDESAPIPDIPNEAEQAPPTDNMEAVLVELMAELRVQKDRVKELEAMLPAVEYHANTTQAPMSAPAMVLTQSGSPGPQKSGKGITWSGRMIRFQSMAARLASSSARWSTRSGSDHGRKAGGEFSLASNSASAFESPLPSMLNSTERDDGPGSSEVWRDVEVPEGGDPKVG